MSEQTGRTAPPSPLAGEGSEALRAGEGGTGGAREAHPSPGGEAPPPSPARGEGKNQRKRRWLVIGSLGLLVAVAAWFFLIRTTEPRNDRDRFQGDWQIAFAGRNTPNAVTVTGDRWELLGGKVYRLTLNEAADPHEIDLDLIDDAKMTGPAVRLHGVYAFDGPGTVRLRVAPGTQPRPKSLGDADAPEWVLTRVKLEPAPERGK